MFKRKQKPNPKNKVGNRIILHASASEKNQSNEKDVKWSGKSKEKPKYHGEVQRRTKQLAIQLPATQAREEWRTEDLKCIRQARECQPLTVTSGHNSNFEKNLFLSSFKSVRRISPKLSPPPPDNPALEKKSKSQQKLKSALHCLEKCPSEVPHHSRLTEDKKNCFSQIQ